MAPQRGPLYFFNSLLDVRHPGEHAARRTEVRDQLLAAQIPLATFEATDVEGIRDEFRRSIDEYLASCEEDGVQPMKPFSGRLNVRLGSELHQEVARAAEAEGTSINSWILKAVRERTGRYGASG